MYGIIQWLDNNNFLTFIQNENGSVKIFDKLEEADKYANEIEPNDSVRVVSLESVNE